MVVRRLRTILRIVLLILYTHSPPDPGQEIVFRRNIKTGAQQRALRLYSDAKAEVLTPHSRNTHEQNKYNFYMTKIQMKKSRIAGFVFLLGYLFYSANAAFYAIKWAF